MKFIEALKLKNKLFFLFTLITFALVILGMMGRVNVENMKNSIDNVYFGSLVPVSELNEILYQYNAVLAPSVYKIKNNFYSFGEFTQNIEDALAIIKKKWQSYQSHYKTQEELAYDNYTAMEIAKTNQYFQTLLHALQKGRDPHKIALNILEKKIDHINIVIRRLLRYEMDMAYYNRSIFRKSYKVMINNITFILVGIIIAVLFVTYYVFKSIQKEQTKLEATTKALQKANKKLEDVSYSDSLTKLHNRRYFNYVFEREVKRAQRDKKYITFMMIDIDYFKQYNDTYGHIAGDHTLQIVAQSIKSCFKRPSDFVFRLGGEEFGVLLIDTDELGSARLAKEICKKVKAQQIEHKASKVSEYVTVSVGVMCCIADESLEAKELIKNADEMLYKAKESGRDQYMIATGVDALIENVA